jgi:predicted  nucleic acid-binding Zn-ribbon protein
VVPLFLFVGISKELGMPATRRPESNTMLYTVVTFVFLFLVAAVAAVVYYVKFEDQRTIALRADSELAQMITDAQLRKIGAIVGDKAGRETYVGKMVGYHNRTTSLILGGPLDETSAQVKAAKVEKELFETVNALAQEPTNLRNLDPNTMGLVGILKNVKAELDKNIASVADLNQKLAQLHTDFDDFRNETNAKEQELLAEKERYKQQVDEIEQRYTELSELTKKTKDQQVQSLTDERDQARSERRKTYNELGMTKAQLATMQERMKRIQEQLDKTKGLPDTEVAAFKPDGEVIFVNDQIVHLNIGIDDHVYSGLTFSVYDGGMPIPRDGRGKAELEVFDVGKNVSSARVIRSERKRPIMAEDIVANLVWDSDQTNLFAVAGDFDLDNDGQLDSDAGEKVKELIAKFGGKVEDTVSVDTDFVLLGKPPRTLKQPTIEDRERDPLAPEKYQASLQRRAHYDQLRSQAGTLWVPVLNTERFLYFVGYKTLAPRPGRL